MVALVIPAVMMTGRSYNNVVCGHNGKYAHLVLTPVQENKKGLLRSGNRGETAPW
jgi:hypothetical protein